jgi:tight adherence protein C
MYFMIFVFWAGAIVLVLVAIKSLPKPVSLRAKLAPEEMEQLKMLQRRTFMGYALPFSGKFLDSLRLRKRIKAQLTYAHIKFTPEEFLNMEIALAVVFSIACTLALKRIDPVAILSSILAAYLIPDIWLRQKIKKLREQIASMLPEVVDILALCVEAGMDFITSLQWIIEKSRGVNPVLDEMRFLLEEIKWGKPRTQALKDMAKRLNIPEVRLFVSTLIQAERMGTPMVEALAIISEDTRMQRFHRGERMALKAPLKILIPLVFCILPVIGIIIAGPILLQFVEGSLFHM